MSKLTLVNAKKLHDLLLKLGFVAVRQRGSHVFYRHPDGRTCTVPHHGSKDILRPVLRSILRDIKVDPEEYQELLKNL